MKKIECIMRPNKLEEVKNAFADFGIKGMTVTMVMGCGLQMGRTEVYRGSTYTVNLIQKVKIEVVVSDNILHEVVEMIKREAYTGKIGDGKLFIYDIEDAIRIRTGESGESAI